MKRLFIIMVSILFMSCEKQDVREHEEQQKSMKKDAECPIIAITSPTDKSYVNGIVNIKGVIADNVGVREIVMSDQFGNVHRWGIPEHKRLRTVYLDIDYHIGLDDRILTFEAVDCSGNSALPQQLTLYVPVY